MCSHSVSCTFLMKWWGGRIPQTESIAKRHRNCTPCSAIYSGADIWHHGDIETTCRKGGAKYREQKATRFGQFTKLFLKQKPFATNGPSHVNRHLRISSISGIFSKAVLTPGFSLWYGI